LQVPSNHTIARGARRRSSDVAMGAQRCPGAAKVLRASKISLPCGPIRWADDYLRPPTPLIETSQTRSGLRIRLDFCHKGHIAVAWTGGLDARPQKLSTHPQRAPKSQSREWKE